MWQFVIKHPSKPSTAVQYVHVAVSYMVRVFDSMTDIQTSEIFKKIGEAVAHGLNNKG